MLPAEIQEEIGLLPGFISNVPAHHVAIVLSKNFIVPKKSISPVERYTPVPLL
jgi:hypothetical protein